MPSSSTLVFVARTLDMGDDSAVSTETRSPYPFSCRKALVDQLRSNRSTTSSEATIKFTQPWTPTRTVRQKELDVSARRSHAARLVARRKKEEQPKLPDPKLLPSSQPADNMAVMSRPLGPPALWKGDSDPFDSYAISVSPYVNRMIVFARTSYYPSLSYAPWLRRWYRPKDREASLFFDIGLSSADSMGAHLASYGAVLLRILPKAARRQLERAWLEVKYRALRTLRLSLAAQSSTALVPITVTQQCLYLCQADIEARMFSSAKLHSKTLRYLFTRTPLNPKTAYLFLCAMQTVLQIVSFELEAPVMTYDDWHPQTWRSTWTIAEDMLASVSPQLAENTHSGITFPYLRQVLSRFRLSLAPPSSRLHASSPNIQEQLQQTSLWSSRMLVDPQVQKEFELVSLWSATRLIDDTVKLLAHFLALTERHPQLNAARADMLWEATLTLTTACTIRHYLGSPRLDDSAIDLRDASHVIAPRFRDTLMDLLATISEKDLQQHAEVLLWVFFTGALYEQKSSLYRQQTLGNLDRNDDSIWWFSKVLAQQARSLALTSWNDARKMLEQFAYGDGLLDPSPETWWDGIFKL